MLPNLLHPVPVQIEALQRPDTVVDPDYREPIQNAARGPRTTVPGQIAWTTDEGLRPSAAGPEEASDGYILFRRVDLRAAGIPEIHMGDRFVAIGTGANIVNVDLYVTRLRYQGHYPDQGGPTLVKAFFRDRQPSKQTRGGK